MLYYDKRVRYYLIHWKQKYNIEYYSGLFVEIVAVPVASENFLDHCCIQSQSHTLQAC